MSTDKTLLFSGDDSVADLIGGLKALGYTPESHPMIVKDMRRAFNEASAHANLDLEDDIRCVFSFDADDRVTATVTKFKG